MSSDCWGRKSGGPETRPYDRKEAGQSSIFSWIAIALLFALGFGVPSAHAQGRAECRSVQSKILGRAVPYCVILPPSYDSQQTQRYPVLYSLHGLGGTAQTLIQSGGLDLIEDLWQQKRIGEFLIVTPDAGRSFYVNEREGRVRY
jgi:S-formylglutathione hydrolase FrmB